MKKKYQTEQEQFWVGEFGNNYIQRNASNAYLASNISFFASILSRIQPPESIIELGANIGMNLKAIQSLLPQCHIKGIEINERAHQELGKVIGLENAIHASILEHSSPEKCDLSFIKGVLIHIAPEMLGNAYQCLYGSSNRYILIAEYYSSNPTSIEYRGHEDRLFKRDFAGDMMDRYPDLELLDYGFVYHRDRNFPQDDITWFLLEKSQNDRSS